MSSVRAKKTREEKMVDRIMADNREHRERIKRKNRELADRDVNAQVALGVPLATQTVDCCTRKLGGSTRDTRGMTATLSTIGPRSWKSRHTSHSRMGEGAVRGGRSRRAGEHCEVYGGGEAGTGAACWSFLPRDGDDGAVDRRNKAFKLGYKRSFQMREGQQLNIEKSCTFLKSTKIEDEGTVKIGEDRAAGGALRFGNSSLESYVGYSAAIRPKRIENRPYHPTGPRRLPVEQPHFQRG
jgi:hypothetical protein